MSWQLAAFAIVLATLGGRLLVVRALAARPPSCSRWSAALAALAALGRDAFAAVPDVKPITAIVLVAGMAFGAAPGFATGALAALASNMLLGEGPWTPWQMLGWGLVGLLGAGFGALAGRRASPLAIALACALAAEAFNLVLDLYTWTGTGNHTLAGFGVVLGAARCSTSPTWSRASSSAWRSARSCCGCCCGSARECTSAGAPRAGQRNSLDTVSTGLRALSRL